MVFGVEWVISCYFRSFQVISGHFWSKLDFAVFSRYFLGSSRGFTGYHVFCESFTVSRVFSYAFHGIFFLFLTVFACFSLFLIVASIVCS